MQHPTRFSWHVIATAALILPAAFSSPSVAGMRQDLKSCTAAQGRAATAACTRVMNSGRLPRKQFYIGYFNRGSAYRRAGDSNRALADFNRALKRKPGFVRGYIMRAVTYDDLGNHDKALADLNEAVRRDGKSWSALFIRATVLRAEKRYDDALDDLRKGAKLKPSKVKVRLLRALILADRGDIAEARDEINDVITEGNAIPEAFYVRAEIAFAENRLEAARTDVDKAIKRAPTLVAAHALKGRILDARGDAVGAEKAYRKARQLPVDGFEVRPARRLARAGLNAKAAKAKRSKSGADVALNASAGKVECKRFLPATGTIITADCDD
jgi:tetratricopeptide (TPR) repeat protein